MNKSNELIAYIIRALSGKITKTQLVKLMFLADVESIKFTSDQISDIQWKFHHYGPYDELLDDRLGELSSVGVVSVEERQKVRNQEETYFLYKYNNQQEVKFDFSPNQKEIIDTIIKQFGSFTLDSLLEYVYKMPLMQKTKRGDYIDLKQMLDGQKRE